MKSILQFPRSFGLIAVPVAASLHDFRAVNLQPPRHLLGDADEETPSETPRFAAQVCHLLGDMSLEDDCA